MFHSLYCMSNSKLFWVTFLTFLPWFVEFIVDDVPIPFMTKLIKHSFLREWGINSAVWVNLFRECQQVLPCNPVGLFNIPCSHFSHLPFIGVKHPVPQRFIRKDRAAFRSDWVTFRRTGCIKTLQRPHWFTLSLWKWPGHSKTSPGPTERILEWSGV